MDRGQHAGGLFAAHDADAAVRPGEQEPRRIGAAAHAIVAGPETAADQDGELGRFGRSHRGDQLGPVLGDAAGLIFAADHEAGDVLQEHQGNLALAGQFDEVGALERAFRKQHPVIGQDGHWLAPDAGEAADQGGPIERLELVETGAVDDAGDHLAHVIGRAHIGGHDPIELLRVIERRLDLGQHRTVRLGLVEIGHDRADDAQGVLVIDGHMVDHARAAAVGVRPTQFRRRDHLAGRRLHQRRAAEEDGALALLARPAHDHRLVGHGRHIGPAGGATAHDAGDLGYALGAHPRLVEEDAAKVVAVGKHLGLVRQVGPAAIDQIDARQPVLLGDLLGAQVLLHRHGEIGAAFDRGVIGHDHHLAPRHPADARDHARPGRLAAIEIESGQLADLQERRAQVQQTLDPFARQKLAPGLVPLARRHRPAKRRLRHPLAQDPGQAQIDLAIAGEPFGRCVHQGGKD